jgi:hypothetical protein
VVGMSLPPECVPANCVLATTNGSYPQVFNNALVDSSFGITAKIILDELTTSGTSINSLEVPNSSQLSRRGPGECEGAVSFHQDQRL